MIFIPQRLSDIRLSIFNEEFVGEQGMLRGKMILYVGLVVSKDHDCLQSFALVGRERCSSGASRLQLEARKQSIVLAG